MTTDCKNIPHISNLNGGSFSLRFLGKRMYTWAHKNREDNVRAGVLVSGVDANEERKKGHRTVGRCLYDALSRVEDNPRLPTVSRFPV